MRRWGKAISFVGVLKTSFQKSILWFSALKHNINDDSRHILVYMYIHVCVHAVFPPSTKRKGGGGGEIQLFHDIKAN